MAMPGYRRGFSRRRSAMSLNVINSIKNVMDDGGGLTSTSTVVTLAKAVTAPSPTVTTDVSHGCIIKAIWVVLDVCGLAGTGVLAIMDAYMFKNPGANLTPPNASSVGSSNEKKFVFKQWRAMTMRNQDGNNPYHWEGWIKIPKRYQRMGTDDILQLVLGMSASTTGHYQIQGIYKWYR